jgi:nucleotide-binding universal stress UspA family protein
LTTKQGEHEHRIVVGVDGSDSSKAALAWAVGQARLTGAVVNAVTVWDVPLTVRTPWPLTWKTDFKGLAKRMLADVITDVPDSDGKAEITPSVVRGDAAQILPQTAEGADLLVVGTRGHTGLVEAVLGSVGQASVHHAPCPVVIVRSSSAAQAPGSAKAANAHEEAADHESHR